MNKHKQVLAKQELGVVIDTSLKVDEGVVIDTSLKVDEGVFPKCVSHDCKRWSTITDNVTGEILCGSCGLILEEKSLETIIPSYGYDLTDYLTKKSSGSSNSLTMFDMNMTTIMSDRDGTGKSLSRTAKNEFYRLKLLNTRSTVASKNSAQLYRKAVRIKMTVGRRSKNIMCACIYASCKQDGIPRSILEISHTSNIGKKEIARTYRSLVEKLDLSINPFSSSEFLARIANEAKISEKSRRDALEIIHSSEKA